MKVARITKILYAPVDRIHNETALTAFHRAIAGIEVCDHARNYTVFVKLVQLEDEPEHDTLMAIYELKVSGANQQGLEHIMRTTQSFIERAWEKTYASGVYL